MYIKAELCGNLCRTREVKLTNILYVQLQYLPTDKAFWALHE